MFGLPVEQIRFGVTLACKMIVPVWLIILNFSDDEERRQWRMFTTLLLAIIACW